MTDPSCCRVSVVVVSHNRRAAVVETINRLTGMPDRPAVILVDNASTDGTASAVSSRFPGATVLRLPRNRGAAGRNAGVIRARTPLVAFADDDSWWQPGALDRAAAHFREAPRLGLLAGHVLVGDELRPDPICAAMADSPLPVEPDLPGPPVRGFLACGAIVRRRAFLSVGGFSELLFFLCEEQELALRLVAAGWGCAYAADVVAEHHPQRVSRQQAARRRLHRRNEVLTDWLSRPLATAVPQTLTTARAALTDPVARGALVDAGRRLPDVWARRRVIPRWLEDQLRALAS